MFQDDYLACADYQNQPKHSKENRFSAFFHEASKRYFFALVGEKGEVLLKSEGYPQAKSRDNGIQSVIKNLPVRERFSVVEIGNEFVVSLSAGNRQEIARSCGFTKKASAEAFIGTFFGETAKAEKPTAAKTEKAAKAPKAEKVAVAAKTEKAAKAPKVEKLAEAVKEIKPAAAKTAKPAEVKAEKVAVVDTPAPVAEKTTKTKTAKATATKTFLPLDAYLNHQTLSDEYGPTGYAKFESAEGLFCFCVYNPDGSIYLRSEGFATADMRDTRLTAVQNSIIDPQKYRIVEEGPVFVVALVNEKDQEVARSADYTSFTEAFSTTPFGRTKTEGIVLY